LATAPAAKVCDAPDRFSITMVWPICLETCSNTNLETRSMALPGVSATSTRIGCRIGQSWACAEAVPTAVASMLANAVRAKRRRVCTSCLPEIDQS
jgi:hypothetical protein